MNKLNNKENKLKLKSDKKGLNIFEDDRFLKLISILLAVIAWYIVITNDDSDYERTFNIPVQIDIEGTAISKLGLDIVEGTGKTVDIKVKGKNYVVDNLKESDFEATAQLSHVTEPGTYQLKIDVRTKSNADFKIISNHPQTINVKFDKMTIKKFPVQTDITGIEVEDGYLLDKSYASPAEIIVSGPQADVDKIARVVTSVKLKEILNKTIVTKSDIVLLDKNGEKFDSKNIKIDTKEANITLLVLKKKLLNLTFDFLNAPSDFDPSKLGSVMSNRQIEVAGPKNEIDKLTEIHLGYVDLKKLNPGDSITFDVELPKGFINIENINSVKVDFPDKNMTNKIFNVSNIKVINEPSDLKVTLVTRRISNVKLVGDASILSKLSAGSIVAEIDLSTIDVKKGQQNVPVKINIPGYNSIWALGDYTAIINAK